MRIKADSEEGHRVKRVLLDGKPVLDVLEFDTDEGWVTQRIPKLAKLLSIHTSQDHVDTNQAAPEFDYQLVTRQGNVTVEFLEEENGKT